MRAKNVHSVTEEKEQKSFLRRRWENQKERKKVKLCEIARLNVWWQLTPNC